MGRFERFKFPFEFSRFFFFFFENSFGFSPNLFQHYPLYKYKSK